MHVRRAALAVLLVAGGLVAARAVLRPADRSALPITVSAAISLSDALEAAAGAFRSAGGGEVRFNFAGSNVLARQIVSGAPVDLFVSADAAQMDVVAAAGEVVVGTRIDLLANRLAVVLAPAAPAVSEVSGLEQSGIRRIALGDPAAVPAGAYARQFLQSAGHWERLAARIVPVANVRAALAAAEAGTVEAAIVYESDLSAGSRARLAFVVSGPHAPVIVYPAAVLARSRNRAAADQFLAFLRGPAASAIFRNYKFEPRAELR
jgi:molybdate transport system substrate-binding protein